MKKFVVRTPPEFAETVPEPWMACVAGITANGEQLIRGFGTKKEATAWARSAGCPISASANFRRAEKGKWDLTQGDETIWDEGKIISPRPPTGPDCRE